MLNVCRVAVVATPGSPSDLRQSPLTHSGVQRKRIASASNINISVSESSKVKFLFILVKVN